MRCMVAVILAVPMCIIMAMGIVSFVAVVIVAHDIMLCTPEDSKPQSEGVVRRHERGEQT